VHAPAAPEGKSESDEAMEPQGGEDRQDKM